MVLPFPNEIWLHIFRGLATEGEYDTLERCRVVCREFHPMAQECLSQNMTFKSAEEVERIKVDFSGGEMRRWRGPRNVHIEGGDSEDGRRPIPQLATFASRFTGNWPSVVSLTIFNAAWRARDLDADAVFRDLARFASITSLFLYDVIFPTILTLGRLVCALPRLKELSLHGVRFTQQPFDASTISQFRLLPRMQLETLTLNTLDNGSVPTPSFVELVSFISAVSNRICLVPVGNPAQVYLWSAVRTLHLSSVVFPSVATLARLLCALPSLEGISLGWSCMFSKHGFDPRIIPVHPCLPPRLVTLHLDLRMDVGRRSIADLADFFITTGMGRQLQDIMIPPCTSLRVTKESDVDLNRLVRYSGQSLRRLNLDSSWLIYDSKDVWLPAAQSADWRTLMDGLPQIDEVLSWPIFENLVNVSIGVRTWDGLDVRDEERAEKLRACLPKLDERGILGFGMHWDDVTNSCEFYGMGRGAAREAVIIDEVSGADGDTCVSPCDDSEAVSAPLEVVSASSEARANVQPPSSSYPTDSRRMLIDEGLTSLTVPHPGVNDDHLDLCYWRTQALLSAVSRSTPPSRRRSTCYSGSLRAREVIEGGKMHVQATTRITIDTRFLHFALRSLPPIALFLIDMDQPIFICEKLRHRSPTRHRVTDNIGNTHLSCRLHTSIGPQGGELVRWIQEQVQAEGDLSEITTMDRAQQTLWFTSVLPVVRCKNVPQYTPLVQHRQPRAQFFCHDFAHFIPVTGDSPHAYHHVLMQRKDSGSDGNLQLVSDDNYAFTGGNPASDALLDAHNDRSCHKANFDAIRLWLHVVAPYKRSYCRQPSTVSVLEYLPAPVDEVEALVLHGHSALHWELCTCFSSFLSFGLPCCAEAESPLAAKASSSREYQMRYIAMDEALPSQRLTAVRIAYSRSHDMLLALRVLAERSERDENKAVARGVCTMRHCHMAHRLPLRSSSVSEQATAWRAQRHTSHPNYSIASDAVPEKPALDLQSAFMPSLARTQSTRARLPVVGHGLHGTIIFRTKINKASRSEAIGADSPVGIELLRLGRSSALSTRLEVATNAVHIWRSHRNISSRFKSPLDVQKTVDNDFLAYYSDLNSIRHTSASPLKIRLSITKKLGAEHRNGVLEVYADSWEGFMEGSRENWKSRMTGA
ncbi:predicted protein [Postia placenta Mad-698-R]|nr:predicted protein [Postia placenta Mad-698-R]